MSFIKSMQSFSIEQSTPSGSVGDPKAQKLRVEFSDFGDGACGEPAFAQTLVLDFTPDAEIDNDISQKKICDFWEFINNTPEIKNLMVKPEKYIKKPSAAAEDIKEQPVSMAKTACSVLEDSKKKDLIAQTLEGMRPPSYCSLGSREYKENEDICQTKKTNRVPIICECTKICQPCPVKKPTGPPPLSKAKQLCKKLREWDEKHPKSMEPPGHPPSLQHCFIQRQVFDS